MIRVEVEHLPKPIGRIKKTLWLWWSGEGEPDLDLCRRAYLRRFDIEHTFRFTKGTLGWTTPSLQMPEQADRWTWVVIAAYTQLRLARQLVEDLRLPWEPRCDPEKPLQRESEGGFDDCVQLSAHPPIHRNPRRPVRDDQKALEDHPEPVIPQSKRLHEQPVEV